jgi:dTDP-4-dehydrorhamnose reductase
MRIFITGAHGMLGSSLVQVMQKTHTLITPTREELNITNQNALKAALENARPDAIIHLAAMTDVDLCELHPKTAYQTNAKATETIARYAKAHHTYLVYVSTGAVFSGRKRTPYCESDPTGPVNVYGRTKLAGEEAVKKVTGSLILRSGWLIGGGAKDKKFVAKIIAQLYQGTTQIRAVCDTVGSPTLTHDLARAILRLVQVRASGVLHVVNTQTASRYDIANVIVRHLHLQNKVRITPVKQATFRLPAKRPRMEALDSRLLRTRYAISLPSWKKELPFYLKTYLRKAFP